MNPAHVHLLINHLPIFGAFLAIPLLGIALWRRGEPAVLLGPVLLLVLAGGGAAGSYLTGEPAEEVVEEIAGVSEAWIEVHEERAEAATVLAALTAIGGITALAWAWKKGATPVPATAGVLAGALLTAGAMAWTGWAGGQIRHTEIRDGDPSAAATPPEVDEESE